jgi:hypothetical protein
MSQGYEAEVKRLMKEVGFSELDARAWIAQNIAPKQRKRIMPDLVPEGTMFLIQEQVPQDLERDQIDPLELLYKYFELMKRKRGSLFGWD